MKMFRKWSLTIAIVLLGVLVSFSVEAYFSSTIRPMQIVCLGDSITSGFRLPYPKTYSFPSQLSLLSDQKWRILNAGVPGATAIKKGDIPIWSQGAFFSVMETTPDVVILMLGTNDMKNKNWRYINSFDEDYTELVLKLKNLPGRPEVIVCSVPPIAGFKHYGITNERATQLSARVKQIAKQEGVHYLELSPLLKGKPELFLDGLHPNIDGDTIIAQQLKETILNL